MSPVLQWILILALAPAALVTALALVGGAITALRAVWNDKSSIFPRDPAPVASVTLRVAFREALGTMAKGIAAVVVTILGSYAIFYVLR